MKWLKFFAKNKIYDNEIIVVKPVGTDANQTILYDNENDKYYRPYKFQIIDKIDKNIDDFIDKLRETSINQADYIVELERRIKVLETKNTELTENNITLKENTEQQKNYYRNSAFDLNQIIQKKNKLIVSQYEIIKNNESIIEQQKNNFNKINIKNNNKNRLINILLENNKNKKSVIKNQNDLLNLIINKQNNEIAVNNSENNKNSDLQIITIKKLEEQIEKENFKKYKLLNEKDNQIKMLTENLNNAKKKIDDLIKILSQNKISNGYKLKLNEINVETIINLCREDFKSLKSEMNAKILSFKSKIEEFEYFENKLFEFENKYKIEFKDLNELREKLINISYITPSEKINNNAYISTYEVEKRKLESRFKNMESEWEGLLNAIQQIELKLLNIADKSENKEIVENIFNQTIGFKDEIISIRAFIKQITKQIIQLKKSKTF